MITPEDLDRAVHAIIAEISTFREEMTQRFDDQSIRLNRHGGLLQTGNRAVVRLHEWSEKVDASLEAKHKEIAELRARIAQIEARLK